jgi:hypothetical protein
MHVNRTKIYTNAFSAQGLCIWCTHTVPKLIPIRCVRKDYVETVIGRHAGGSWLYCSKCASARVYTFKITYVQGVDGILAKYGNFFWLAILVLVVQDVSGISAKFGNFPLLAILVCSSRYKRRRREFELHYYLEVLIFWMLTWRRSRVGYCYR